MFLDCSGLGLKAEELSGFFHDAGIRLSYGTMYREPTGQFVRLNYGCPRSVLEQGLLRIETAVERLKQNGL
jgi:cystathionine beta-lyase